MGRAGVTRTTGRTGDARRFGSQRLRTAGPVLCSCGALLVYLVTLHRSVPAGDSGELMTAARILGVAHPPGYPLYTLIAHAFGASVPWVPYPVRLNALAALFHAATVGVVAVALSTLGIRGAATITAALALAFAGPFWKYALVAEVYSLNSLLAALLLLGFAAVLRDAGLTASTDLKRSVEPPRRSRSPSSELRTTDSIESKSSAWPVALVVLVSALIPSHHHSLLILAVPLGLVTASLLVLPQPWLARRLPGYRRPYRFRPVHGAMAAALLLIGLAPIAYLPIAASHHPVLNWGDPETPGRLLHHLLRLDYGSFELTTFRASHESSANHVVLYAGAIGRDFTFVGALLAIVGLLALLTAVRFPRRMTAARPIACMVFGFAAVQSLFFQRISLPDRPAMLLGIVERFYVLPHIVVACMIGIGVAAILDRLPLPARGAGSAVLVSVAAIAPLVAHFRTIDQRGNTFTADLTANVLESLPPHAVLFYSGDLFFTGLTYATEVEHRRPDVICVDEDLLAYPWYVHALRRRHPGLLPPTRTDEDEGYSDERPTRNLEWLDHAKGRWPVAFLGTKGRRFADRYELVPYGFVSLAYPRGGVPSVGQQIDQSLELLPRLR